MRGTYLLQISGDTNSIALLRRLRDVAFSTIELHQARRRNRGIAARRDILAVGACNIWERSLHRGHRRRIHVESCMHFAHVVEHSRRLYQVNMRMQCTRQTIRCRSDNFLIGSLVPIDIVFRIQHGLYARERKTDRNPVPSRAARDVSVNVDAMNREPRMYGVDGFRMRSDQFFDFSRNMLATPAVDRTQRKQKSLQPREMLSVI